MKIKTTHPYHPLIVYASTMEPRFAEALDPTHGTHDEPSLNIFKAYNTYPGEEWKFRYQNYLKLWSTANLFYQ